VRPLDVLVLAALIALGGCAKGIACEVEVRYDGRTGSRTAFVAHDESSAPQIDARKQAIVEACDGVCKDGIDHQVIGWQRAFDICQKECKTSIVAEVCKESERPRLR
jgi:hypothetical protein